MILLNVGEESRNPIGSKLKLDEIISVGFGEAYVSQDGNLVLAESDDKDIYVRDAEQLAAKNPDSEWLIVMKAPLWDATWKRTAPGQWNCIKAGMGFA